MRDGKFIATTRTGYPLVLAALRAEVERHVYITWEDMSRHCTVCGPIRGTCFSVDAPVCDGVLRIAEKLGIKP